MADITHADVATMALLRAERKEAAKEGWSSHWLDLPRNRQIFSEEQLTALSQLPEIYLPAAEKDLDSLREATGRLASATIALLGLPQTVAAFEAHFVGLLRPPGKEQQALTPGSYQALTAHTIVWLEGTSVAPRAWALFALSLAACRFSPYFSSEKQRLRLERIELAGLCRRPSGVEQVSRWTTRTPAAGTALVELELPLAGTSTYPVRFGGPQVF
jgi:hypothetical protein